MDVATNVATARGVAVRREARATPPAPRGGLDRMGGYLLDALASHLADEERTA
jgi:hypothetical protein